MYILIILILNKIYFCKGMRRKQFKKIWAKYSNYYAAYALRFSYMGNMQCIFKLLPKQNWCTGRWNAYVTMLNYSLKYV